MAVHAPIRLMFLGFGEAASLFATGFAAGALKELAAYAPSVHGGTGAKRLHERAALSGTRLVSDLAAFSAANWIFAMVPPAQALNAARAVSPHLAQGAIYVDFSSAAPRHKIEAAASIESAGAHYVDAAIIGSVPASGHQVPVIASGAHAETFAASFTPLGMDISILGSAIGAAAGTKLVRSILAKGLEALYVEALVVAERSDITQEVLDSFCAFLDARTARATAEILLKSHVVHAARRADEVLMARELVLEAGIPPIMTDAIINLMRQTAESRATERAGRRQPASLNHALDILEAELPGAAQQDTETAR